MTEKNIKGLVKAIAEAITTKEDEVFAYVGIGYVLDQDSLHEVITQAIVDF